MTTRHTQPEIIRPYLDLSAAASLVLVTGTLSHNASWLAASFLSAAIDSNGTLGGAAVLLVSWTQDLAFWQMMIRRTTGLDTTKLDQAGQFAFVNLLADSPKSDKTHLTDLEQLLRTAASNLTGQGRRIILILENPDVLLATAKADALELNLLLLRLRSLAHATVLVSASSLALAPSSTPAPPRTPLEIECELFLGAQAHSAHIVMGVRNLDTGAAHDISGILRISRGGGVHDLAEIGAHEVKEAELLYLTRRDGRVDIFKRGSSLVG